MEMGSPPAPAPPPPPRAPVAASAGTSHGGAAGAGAREGTRARAAAAATQEEEEEEEQAPPGSSSCTAGATAGAREVVWHIRCIPAKKGVVACSREGARTRAQEGMAPSRTAGDSSRAAAARMVRMAPPSPHGPALLALGVLHRCADDAFK